MKEVLSLVLAGLSALALVRPLPAQDAPPLVTTEWLAANQNAPGLVILHVGSEMSYTQGHIPGARLMPTEGFAPTIDEMSTQMPDPTALRETLEAAGISSDSRIVIYAAAHPPQLATRLYITVEHYGLTGRSSLLDGGLRVWQAEGRAVDTSAPAAVARGSLPELHPGNALVADHEYVSARLADGAAAIMDARDAPFYTGEQQNQQNPRPGRIAGAVNVPFRVLVDDSGRFLAAAEIERVFEGAGVEAGRPVVTYCHVGQQASLLFFAARMLGHEARLYDGSFQEWSARPELPVATGP